MKHVICALLLIAAVGSADAETLTMAGFQNRPYIICGEDGPSGLHYELAKEVLTAAGIDTALECFPQARAIRNFEEGACPLLLGTPEFFGGKTDNIYFVHLFKVEIVFFYSKKFNAGFSWQVDEDLKKYRISDIISGAGNRLLEDRNIPYEPSPDQQSLFRKLASGRIDLAVGPDLGGFDIMDELKLGSDQILTYPQKPLLRVDVGLVLSGKSKNADAIFRELKKGLEKIYSSGKWKEIMTRYYKNHPRSPDSEQMVETFLRGR